MRDAGHRTPDAGHRTSDNGHRTSDGEKSKNNISTPQGGGHNDLGALAVSSVVCSILSSSKRPFYKILLGNYRGDLCPYICADVVVQ